jgi:hypothetical protein
MWMAKRLLKLTERMGLSSVMRKDLSQYGSVWVRRLGVSDYVTKQKETPGLTWLTVSVLLGRFSRLSVDDGTVAEISRTDGC